MLVTIAYAQNVSRNIESKIIMFFMVKYVETPK